MSPTGEASRRCVFRCPQKEAQKGPPQWPRRASPREAIPEAERRRAGRKMLSLWKIRSKNDIRTLLPDEEQQTHGTGLRRLHPARSGQPGDPSRSRVRSCARDREHGRNQARRQGRSRGRNRGRERGQTLNRTRGQNLNRTRDRNRSRSSQRSRSSRRGGWSRTGNRNKTRNQGRNQGRHCPAAEPARTAA